MIDRRSCPKRRWQRIRAALRADGEIEVCTSAFPTPEGGDDRKRFLIGPGSDDHLPPHSQQDVEAQKQLHQVSGQDGKA